MPMEARLRIEDLSYGFPKRVIGRHFSFELKAGEVLCVLGPNGCGKTTLFRTVLGLLPPRAGAVRLGERPVHGWGRGELARVIGYVPQAHSGYFAFTVREIVLMGRTTHLSAFATPGRHDWEEAERVMALLGISHLADQVYTRISGGERQLALIGRALAQEPAVLVLDEPTASLDFGNQVLVLNHIASLARQGIAVMFSTHDPDQAFVCADRVLMLRDGEIVCHGEPAVAITSDNLRRLYGVEVTVVDVPAGPGEGWRKTCVPHALPGSRPD